MVARRAVRGAVTKTVTSANGVGEDSYVLVEWLRQMEKLRN
jgi:hypothetical protein